MLGSRTDLHIFDAGSVTGPVIVTRFFLHMCVILEALWVFGSFHGRQCTMSSHSCCRIALREADAWQLVPSPVTIRELRLALQDEWAMPKQLD
ncbi:hypothetical protein TNCV_4904981 [Trichonephila clavipes]|uniref:Uncharacterized protein n=1 Tax=Trichonephila clavipes TaxID=2585209 RepID=A0A8X6V7K1_TRICX|nr:hypothetical protein TNCV_4904981 [Trichonephila clavipes]